MLLINKNLSYADIMEAVFYSNLDMDNQIDELFNNKSLIKHDDCPLTKKEYDACITAINSNVKKFVNAKKKLADLKSKIEAFNGQELNDDIKNKIDSFNTNYQKIGDSVLHNSLIIRETLDKLDGYEPNVIVKKEVFDNNVLRISEIDKKIYLPYTVEEVKEVLNDSGKYHSEQEVVENYFTIPTTTYMNFFTGRYKEVVSLISRTQNCEVGKMFALGQMFNSKVHPAIIRSCRTMNDYYYYLKCLENNNLEDFKLFDIKYEVPPTQVKAKEFSFEKE
jgi:hypothetical protein